MKEETKPKQGFRERIEAIARLKQRYPQWIDRLSDDELEYLIESEIETIRLKERCGKH